MKALLTECSSKNAYLASKKGADTVGDLEGASHIAQAARPAGRSKIGRQRAAKTNIMKAHLWDTTWGTRYRK